MTHYVSSGTLNPTHSPPPLPEADLLQLWPLTVWQSLAVVVLVSAADQASPAGFQWALWLEYNHTYLVHSLPSCYSLNTGRYRRVSERLVDRDGRAAAAVRFPGRVAGT